MVLNDDYIGKDFGEYRPTSLLAKQGQKRVYLAQSTTLRPSRLSVIKVFMVKRLGLHPSNERKNFLQATQSLKQLRHPHLLPIIDVGIKDGWPYVIMDYAENGSLRQHMDQQAPTLLPIKEILALVEQIGSALDYLKRQNIVHGAVKPENILFTKDQQAQLADISPLIPSQINTPRISAATKLDPYQAPEQRMGQKSAHSDQFALSCIAYELLTGQQQFANQEASSQQIFTDTVPPTQYKRKLPPEAEQVLHKGSARLAEERYISIKAFCYALRAAFEPTIANTTNNQPIQQANTNVALANTAADQAIAWIAQANQSSQQTPVTGVHAAYSMAETQDAQGWRVGRTLVILLIITILGILMGVVSGMLLSKLQNNNQTQTTLSSQIAQRATPSATNITQLVVRATSFPSPTSTKTVYILSLSARESLPSPF